MKNAKLVKKLNILYLCKKLSNGTFDSTTVIVQLWNSFAMQFQTQVMSFNATYSSTALTNWMHVQP